MVVVNIKVMMMPVKRVLRALIASSLSARHVAKARATFGPRKGAMTMAPMITATLFCNKPMAATMVERQVRKTKHLKA